MTRLSMTIMLAGTAVALLATTPGRAADAFNGISLNGISLNGISRNGFVGDTHSTNAAGEIGSAIAIELPR